MLLTAAAPGKVMVNGPVPPEIETATLETLTEVPTVDESAVPLAVQVSPVVPVVGKSVVGVLLLQPMTTTTTAVKTRIRKP